MAQVFIVDERTLSVHLRNAFAGTGARDLSCDFLNSKENDINASVERLLSGMIADISRIRKNDDILFYLQQTRNHEGMFFGGFKAKDKAFLCNDRYLEEELGKNLTFRVEIMPGEVYPEGITERECLDSLNGITHPSQLCWSLIYRKLKGNRGCTMITDYEFNQIMKKIVVKNKNKKLQSNYFDYDANTNKIVSSEQSNIYLGKKSDLNIMQRMIYKNSKRNAYETHLQAYVLQNLENIKPLLISDGEITWIGNEVSCGVGMQSIDIAFMQNNENNNIIICELKDEQPKEYIKNQMQKYIDWMSEYIVPLYKEKIIIIPTIVAPYPKDNAKEMFEKMKHEVSVNNEKMEVKPIRYIGFNIKDNTISFEEV